MWQSILDWFKSGFKGVSTPEIDAIKTPLDEQKEQEVAKQYVMLDTSPVYGDSSNDVKKLKVALNKQKVVLVKLDEDNDYFGTSTRNTVSIVQKANGLTGSGEPGPLTLELLGLKVKEPAKQAVNPAYVESKKYEGKKETDKTFGAWVSTQWKKVGLPNYKTIVGTSFAWCALWIGLMNSQVGQDYMTSRGAAAKTYDLYGVAVDWKKQGLPQGAVVRVNSSGNCSSGSGNHVTFADGSCTAAHMTEKGATFPGFGGNQSNQVKRSIYKAANICAVRWPKEQALPGPVTKNFNCDKVQASSESTR